MNKEEIGFGMSAYEIEEALQVGLENAASPEAKVLLVQFAHIQMLALSSRAMSCHCECLGMNAENAMAVCGNYTPPYGEGSYQSVMQKWGMINEKGEPII